MGKISYQLIKKLREGEANSTYRGLAHLPDGHQRNVIIKLLQPRLTQDPIIASHLSGFLDIFRGLHHSGLAPVWDFGRAGDYYFIIREHIEGISLEYLLQAVKEGKATLSPALAIYLTLEIADSLAAIHRYRAPQEEPVYLFHGGLFPSNVILNKVGNVILTDVGLDVIFSRDVYVAKYIAQRKFSYQPPEYRAGQTPLRRGDAYAAASILYQMVVGLPLQEAISQYGEGISIPLPSTFSKRVTDEFDSLLLRFLHPELEERETTIEAFQKALSSPTLLRQSMISKREAMEYIEILVKEQIEFAEQEVGELLFDYPFQIESLLAERPELNPPEQRYRPVQHEDTAPFHPHQRDEVLAYAHPVVEVLDPSSQDEYAEESQEVLFQEKTNFAPLSSEDAQKLMSSQNEYAEESQEVLFQEKTNFAPLSSEDAQKLMLNAAQAPSSSENADEENLFSFPVTEQTTLEAVQQAHETPFIPFSKDPVDTPKIDEELSSHESLEEIEELGEDELIEENDVPPEMTEEKEQENGEARQPLSEAELQEDTKEKAIDELLIDDLYDGTHPGGILLDDVQGGNTFESPEMSEAMRHIEEELNQKNQQQNQDIVVPSDFDESPSSNDENRFLEQATAPGVSLESFGNAIADDKSTETPPQESQQPSLAPQNASSAQQKLEEEEGEEFGPFVLLNRIALGGMAEVFRAKKKGLDGFQRLVAIKRILPEYSQDPNFIQMFKDEARIAGSLSHPHIVPIHELGEIDGTYFISMAYIDGIDLARVIKIQRAVKGHIPVELIVVIAIAVCRALHYAHEEVDLDGNPLEMIHRDVTPHNVLLSRKGEIKLTDFGIAKAARNVAKTAVGELKGKLSYMSPEQAMGLKIDKRTDIFQVGILIYEMLTLQKIFEGASEQEILAKIKSGHYVNVRSIMPDIHPDLERIINKALARNPEDRYQTAAEFEADLLQFQALLNARPEQFDVAPFVEKVLQQRDDLMAQYQAAQKNHSEHLLKQKWKEQLKAAPQTPAQEKQAPSPLPQNSIDFDPLANIEEQRFQADEPKKKRSSSFFSKTTLIVLIVLLFLTLLGGGVLFYFSNLEPPSALLTVNSNPIGATVFFDGKLLGKTPLSEKKVPFDRKKHILKLSKKGYESISRTIHFRQPDDVANLAIMLTKTRSQKRIVTPRKRTALQKKVPSRRSTPSKHPKIRPRAPSHKHP